MNVWAAGRVLSYMRTLPVLLALSVFPSFPQGSSTISLSNGVQVRITTNPPVEAGGHLKAEMKPATGNSVFRVFRDETGLAVYAYELVVDQLPDGTHYQVIAKPAGEEFAAKFPNADGGKPTPTLPRPFESPPLPSGGRFTVEIPTNPGWFEHRTDEVVVGAGVGAAQSMPALRFAGLQVRIGNNGTPVFASGSVVAGRYVMFYIPGRGGYFFANEPVQGRPFVQGATVDGTHLKFVVDNQAYDCVAEAPILVASERGQIWVYRDRNYKPSGNLTKRTGNRTDAPEFFTAASDSLDWWLP